MRSEHKSLLLPNQPDVASTELEVLIRLAPTDMNARASLGMVLFTEGRYEQAARNFEAVLARSPSSWNAKAFLGMCELRLGKADRGPSDIEAALPKLTDKLLRRQAGLALADSYAEKGRQEKAALIIEDLRQDDPDNADLLFAAYRIHSRLASAALEKLAAVGA